MRRGPFWVITTGATLTSVASAIALGGPPGEIELAVFRWFNDPPGVLGLVLDLVDPLLRPVALTLLVGVVLAVLALTPREVFWPLVGCAATAGLLGYVLDHILKYVVDRGRPPAYLEDVLYHGYPVDPRGSGFPSSHTAVTVAVVVGAWPWLTTGWRVGGVTAAALIGLDRMYVGAHLPLDVIGGLGVGLLAGGMVMVAVSSPKLQLL